MLLPYSPSDELAFSAAQSFFISDTTAFHSLLPWAYSSRDAPKLSLKVWLGNEVKFQDMVSNGLNNSDRLDIPKEAITEAIQQLGKGPSVRGETLTLEEFAKLSNSLWQYMQ